MKALFSTKRSSDAEQGVVLVQPGPQLCVAPQYGSKVRSVELDAFMWLDGLKWVKMGSKWVQLCR